MSSEKYTLTLYSYRSSNVIGHRQDSKSWEEVRKHSLQIQMKYGPPDVWIFRLLTFSIAIKWISDLIRHGVLHKSSPGKFKHHLFKHQIFLQKWVSHFQLEDIFGLFWFRHVDYQHLNKFFNYYESDLSNIYFHICVYKYIWYIFIYYVHVREIVYDLGIWIQRRKKENNIIRFEVIYLLELGILCFKYTL